MADKKKDYFVETLGTEPSSVPTVLRSVPNPPSDFRADVTDEELFDALVTHCETSRRQVVALQA